MKRNRAIARRSNYTVVKSESNALAKIVWIVDENGVLSVTNDAERVCAEVQEQYPGHRIIYRDSMGNWDELVHQDGVFQSFAPARHLAA